MPEYIGLLKCAEPIDTQELPSHIACDVSPGSAGGPGPWPGEN